MVRPRWHDIVIIVGIAGLIAFGVWALWWEDVRDLLHLGPGSSAGSASPSDTGSSASPSRT